MKQKTASSTTPRNWADRSFRMDPNTASTMTPRTAAWFVRYIKQHEKAHPAKPIRFDVLRTELVAVEAAHKELPDGWRLRGSAHLHPDSRKQDILRAAFFSPACPRPVPVETVECPPMKGKGWRAWSGPTERLVLKLMFKYGPEYHVELVEHDYPKEKVVCEVWRGSEWLVEKAGAFSPDELVEYLAANVVEVRRLAQRPKLYGARGGRPAFRKTKYEENRGEWDRLRSKGMSAHSAAMILAKKIGPVKARNGTEHPLHPDQIATHFRKHPTAPRQ